MKRQILNITAMVLILGISGIANAQTWNFGGNSSGSTFENIGTNSPTDLRFITENQFRMNLTKSGWLGLGIQQPRGWMEVNYCPPLGTSQTGSIITLHKCHGSAVLANNVTHDFIGGAITQISLDTGFSEGDNPPFLVPINFATGNLTNLTSPLYSNTNPMFWVRTQVPPGLSPSAPGPDEFDTKFIVMPDGSCGINIAAPRAALDVRGSNAPNRPAAIFGSRALGTGYTDPATGLFQYYTQQVHLVPVLKTNGYNQIVQQGDQGLFFTDGKDTLGANLQSAFVLAPWVARNDSTKGGMRMDANGNTEFHGTLRATKVNVDARWWSDFVFADDYKLSSLAEVEAFIATNKHLPNVPSEKRSFRKRIRHC